MTRINVVPVDELCDQHLLAEHRELTRIPNMLRSGILQYDYVDRPSTYVLGEGHVKFFTDKLTYLYCRYQQLCDECRKRGFNIQDIWPLDLAMNELYWNEYLPDEEAIAINRQRIHENMPANPRYYSQPMTGE